MFTSGFFNSINSDRKYNAEQMAAIFDGLITDGIFDSIGDHFQVTPASSGLGVNIGTGRAWLNQTWSYNDTAYPVTLGAASSSLGRKDLICLKVDKSNAVRANSLVVIAGTPAASPVEPTVTDDTTNGIYYHKLAVVTVPAGATSISAANITNYIGLSTGTPYVTGLLSSTTVDELWSQWDGEFNDWWDDIKETLDDNVVTMILNKIDRITPKEATMNLYGFSHINPPPSGKTYAEYSTDAILNQISSLLNNVSGYSIGDIVISANSLESPEYTPVTIGSNTGTGYAVTNIIPEIGSKLHNEYANDPTKIITKVSSGTSSARNVIPDTLTYNNVGYSYSHITLITSEYIYAVYYQTSNSLQRSLFRFDKDGENQTLILGPNYSWDYYMYASSNAIFVAAGYGSYTIYISHDFGTTLTSVGDSFKWGNATGTPGPDSVFERGDYVYALAAVSEYYSGSQYTRVTYVSVNTRTNAIVDSGFVRLPNPSGSPTENSITVCMNGADIWIINDVIWNSNPYQYTLNVYHIGTSNGTFSTSGTSWTTLINAEATKTSSIDLCSVGSRPFKMGTSGIGLLVIHDFGNEVALYSLGTTVSLQASARGLFAYGVGSYRFCGMQMDDNTMLFVFRRSTYSFRAALCKYENGSLLVEDIQTAFNNYTTVSGSDSSYIITDSNKEVSNSKRYTWTDQISKLVELGEFVISVPNSSALPYGKMYYVKQN